MNILTKVKNLELSVKFYNLEEYTFEIFQTFSFKKDNNKCVSRGPYKFEVLLLLIQNDVIQLDEKELDSVLFQIEETINEYIKEIE